MFFLKNRCGGLVDCARTIRSQFDGLQPPPPLLSFTYELNGLMNFLPQDKVQERLMMFLHSLSPTSFSEVPHGGFIRVFHKLIKRSTIPQVESKQIVLSNLRGIVNTLGALDNKRLKNNHPLSVPLPSTYPSSSTNRIPTNLFPTFPEGAS